MKHAFLNTLVAASTVLGLASPALASDHIDGPITTKNRVSDLTDFFAFPTPNKPGFISLVLNTYPLVAKSNHFTDKATFVFMVRKAALIQATSQITTSDEVVINCHVETPNDIEKHVITCKSTNGLAASSIYNYMNPQAAGDNFRLYAGMRSDPFFFNKDFAQDAAGKGKINKPDKSNIMADMNVLSIVIEVEAAKLFPNGQNGMFAMATAVVTRDTPTSPLRILDRIGRPEITNVSMVQHEGDIELRDRYNVDRPFQVVKETQSIYETRLLKNINFYDALDKKTDWNDAGKANLARLLADDFLVLDITKPCNTDSFLEIEKSLVKNQANSTCGGRKITDDIMDTLFTAYIAGLDGARIRDGVDAPNKAISKEFPYLAKPSLGFFDQLKAGIARGVLGL